MDELFTMPSSPVAMPRAYWGPQYEKQLSLQLLVVEPSPSEFERFEAAIIAAPPGSFDMEIVDDLYHDNGMILPHRPYDLLTGEFRSMDHKAYLGNSEKPWNPTEILAEAKFLHFGDWPVEKPWLVTPATVIEEEQPACLVGENGMEDCSNSEIWNDIYNDFRERRLRVCAMSTIKTHER